MEGDYNIFYSDETKEDKIFHSDITRVNFKQTSDLRELLCVTSAKPVPVKVRENDTCIFKPKYEKCYVPKRKPKMKVRTVRDIRNLFEQDNYRFIVEDMEKQQNTLLCKIRRGSAFDHNTQNLAKKLLNADHPISRTAWQMLSNINPEKNANPTQFVLWNGRRIRVVGSKGGKTKFISNYDLEKYNKDVKDRKIITEKNTRKHGLLRNSLSIKFKPGPLGRKQILDDSHQKYHMGPIELVKLPKPALDIQPAFGKVVEPLMANFLNKLRAEDGTISKKWAEFSVSVLGTVKNNKVIQNDPECCVTFDLTYKCGQNRILMRRDICNIPPIKALETAPKYPFLTKSNKNEIKNVLDKILDSVEISLMQDSMYLTEKELPQTTPESSNEINTNLSKEKSKKKYGELDRLAVTVIELPGTSKIKPSKPCEKAYCNLGCVCDSLNCTYKFKQHCGCSECMFGCKCEVPKYKDIELLENGCVELIPELMNFDNAINANLAKEEQKFHQTVVVRGEKSILLKPRKRNTKFSKKYEQFYSNLRVKTEIESKKTLTIVEKKLYIPNIEPWCMVHNLYRCFCKGRFTASATLNSAESLPTSNITTVDLTNAESAEPSDENIEKKNHNQNDFRPRMGMRFSGESSQRKSLTLLDFNLKDIDCDETLITCARVNEYKGRKYNDAYYKITNNKIEAMERNDTTLHNKMLKLMKVPAENPTDGNTQCNRQVKDLSVQLENSRKQGNNNLSSHTNNKRDEAVKKIKESEILEKKADIISESLVIKSNNTENIKTSSEPYIPFEINGDTYKPIDGKKVTQDFLTPWIAISYKHYIEQLKIGKNVLERPKKGRIILHLWECLLDRYRNRRNLFLTTTKRPYRIYIATDIHKPFFKDCINIDCIGYSDLPMYPCVVKKLLTNATCKGYFCILGGWEDCWEIIGSVKKNDKVNVDDDRSSDSNLTNNENSCTDYDFGSSENWYMNEKDGSSSEIDRPQDNNEKLIKPEPETTERSKWFLMKLENDFTDIYCHKKGFYVEHEKLLHAINLARLTHKTVVINKQTSTETEQIPFGIYALPIATDYFAVVGPYEMEEPLGLEIVKSKSVSIQKCTKGYWIMTNKIDNLKVLDDPMSFLPKNTKSTLKNIIMESEEPGGVQPPTMFVDNSIVNIDNNAECNKKNQDETTQKKAPRLIKPIKIRRTNGFYHLTPNSNTILKNMLPSTSKSPLQVKCLVKKDLNEQKSLCPIDKHSDSEIIESDTVPVCAEPETEASHIKITSVYSENAEEIAKQNGKPGMFILKPEEINKKITVPIDNKACLKDEDELEMDIKNFLSSPKANTIDECVVISDDEDDTASNASQKWCDVFIKCSNVNNLGWIRGKRNIDNLLSIDFPGFEPNKLYTESEAMTRINETMSVKVAIPEQVKLKWLVLPCKDPKNVEPGENLLNKPNSAANSNSAGTSKKYRLRLTKKASKTAHTSKADAYLFEDLPAPGATVLLNQNSELFQNLVKTSRLLEDESVVLINEAERRQSEICKTFKLPEKSRLEMSETLQEMKSMNDDLDDDG